MIGYYDLIAEYNPSHNALLFGGGNDSVGGNTGALWRLDPDATITRLADAPLTLRVPGGGTSGGLMTFEPATGRFIYLSQAADLYEFDLESDTWTEMEVELPEVMVNNTNGAVSSTMAVAICTYHVVLYLTWGRGNVGAYVYKHAEPNG